VSTRQTWRFLIDVVVQPTKMLLSLDDNDDIFIGSKTIIEHYESDEKNTKRRRITLSPRVLSAIVIQSFYRMYLQRKQYKKQRKSITLIQIFYKNHLARRKLCEASIRIQTWIRSIWMRKKTRKEYLAAEKVSAELVSALEDCEYSSGIEEHVEVSSDMVHKDIQGQHIIPMEYTELDPLDMDHEISQPQDDLKDAVENAQELDHEDIVMYEVNDQNADDCGLPCDIFYNASPAAIVKLTQQHTKTNHANGITVKRRANRVEVYGDKPASPDAATLRSRNMLEEHHIVETTRVRFNLGWRGPSSAYTPTGADQVEDLTKPNEDAKNARLLIPPLKNLIKSPKEYSDVIDKTLVVDVSDIVYLGAKKESKIKQGGRGALGAPVRVAARAAALKAGTNNAGSTPIAFGRGVSRSVKKRGEKGV